jgi:ribosomal protein S27E
MLILDDHLERLVARLRKRVTPNSPEYVKAIVRQADIIDELQQRLDRITGLADAVELWGKPSNWERLIEHIGVIAEHGGLFEIDCPNCRNIKGRYQHDQKRHWVVCTKCGVFYPLPYVQGVANG